MQSSKRLKTIFLRTLIGAIAIAAFIANGLFLFGSFGDLEIRILITTLALGGFSLTALCSSRIYSKPQLQSFSLTGMAVSVIGFILMVIFVWELWDTDWSWRITADFIILSVALAHISLLLLIAPQTTLINWIRNITFVCIGIVGLMLIWGISNEFENGEFFFRMLGVFAIMDVLGTILVPVLNKISGDNSESG